MNGLATGQFGGRLPLGQLLRFLVVGGTSTAIYAIGTILFTRMAGGRLTAGEASVIAYLLGAVFSYTAHKFFTFRSDGAHGIAIPRFVATTALGLTLSYGLAAILADHFGFPPELPVALASILVPVMNYLILSRWVFAEPAR